MAERSVLEILLRARGAREVYESGKLASRGIDDIGRSIVRTNERSKLLRHGLYGIGAAGATMGVLIYEGAKKSVEAYAEFQGAAAQVDRQIKLTGGSANVTAGHVENLANKLSLTAGIADKFSILGGESLLLTFKNIRNEGGKTTQLFDRTSRAAIDMTSALRAAGKNTTPQQAFMALGRAVSDPAKASQYLRRALVTLSPAEDAHIKRLVVLNKTMQAQEAVLTAVEEKYKGAARTAGGTLAGSLGRLHVVSMNLKEDIGKGLAPAVVELADDLVKLDKQVAPTFKKLGDALHHDFSRRDLSLADQIKLGADDVHKILGPLADQAEDSLKRAHLGTKLEHAIEDAAPYIAQGMAHAGVGAAKAFAHAWWDSDIWGKTFTTAFLLHKFGAFGKLGGLLLGRGKGGTGGVGGALGRLAPTPVFVTNWEKFPGGGGGGGFVKTIERKAPWVRAASSTVAELAGPTALLGLYGNAWMAGGKNERQRMQRLGASAVAGNKVPAGAPPLTGRDRAGRVYSVAVPGFAGHMVAVDPRLSGYPDSHARSRQVAFPVLHATATIHNPVYLDKVKVADGTKQVELTYGSGGRGH